MTDLDQEILTQICPNEYLEVSDEDIVVWVDPLDGTSEYAQVQIYWIWKLKNNNELSLDL